MRRRQNYGAGSFQDGFCSWIGALGPDGAAGAVDRRTEWEPWLQGREGRYEGEEKEGEKRGRRREKRRIKKSITREEKKEKNKGRSRQRKGERKKHKSSLIIPCLIPTSFSMRSHHLSSLISPLSPILPFQPFHALLWFWFFVR